MTDHPFDTVAQEVAAARQEKADAEARFARSCRKVTEAWPIELSPILTDANARLGAISVTFTGGPGMVQKGNTHVGIKYKVSGLRGGPGWLSFEVVGSGQAAVSLSGHKDILTLDPEGPFPKDAIIEAVAQLVKRAALA